MKGHLEQRSKNVWLVVLELGRDADGKRRRHFETFRGAKREAEKQLVRLLHELETGKYIDPSRLTVGQYLERWLKDYAKSNVSPRTYEGYETIIRCHLQPVLGHHLLTKLRPLHIQNCYADLRDNGRRDRKGNLKGELSARTVLHVHRLLREALRHAVQWQILAANPADAVKPPRPDHREMKAFSEEETCRLLGAAKDTRLYVPILTAATTGLRRGELLGLRWEDVDLETGQLFVRQTLQRTGQGLCFRPPKTAKSRRVVVLPAMTIDALKEHKKLQVTERLRIGPAYEDHGLVFPNELGRPWHPSSFTTSWRALAREQGESTFFHGWRHGHATQLLRQGIHPKIVSERLGHSNIGITLDTYSHVLPDMQQEAAARVDDALRRALGKAQETSSEDNGQQTGNLRPAGQASSNRPA